MKTVLSLICMIGLTVIANVFLKVGAVSSEPGQGPLANLLNWKIILGLASFACAACFYILVLRRWPLNVAQSFASAQFIAVIFASAWILSEPIGTGQWLGIGFIAFGIAIVGWSQR